MEAWTQSEQYQKVAEANREYYAKSAQLYDASETCVTNLEIQKQLENDLEQIIAMLKLAPETLHALDACGGTGNVALKLLRRGLNVTISDISETQLAIFQQKCIAENFTTQTLNGEIATLLTNDSTCYDLIVFSSALHHLENISGVLRLAFERLKPGGLLFTVFDPTITSNHHKVTKLVLSGDYLLFKVLDQTSDLPFAIVRRLRRTLESLFHPTSTSKHALTLNEETLGVLAEYHVDRGIDDFALVEQLKQTGFEVVWHLRYPGGRYRLTRWIVGLFKDATQFKLLLRKLDR